MCIFSQIVDCQLNLVLNQKSDRLEIPLQSLTPLICRLWANSALKQPSAAPLPLEVLLEPLVEPLAENEPITASANPPLSHQDPEPEHHPNPEQPPLPNQPSHPLWPHSPRIPTRSPTQSPHTAPHSLPNPPESTISAPTSTASSSVPSRATTSSYSLYLTHGTEKSTLEHATKTQNKHKLTAESLVAEGDDTKPSNSSCPKTV
ncbi:unnamed protein product [Microthlaspi erraticum]|uniref:Uncharacterized protein n=1 Tax=Microthlaspi erraticum TaxID=1685480 RepID=A0A6D2HA88_9BRAS|nr:unnamed protein product [Microthlaspi erraticum]